MTWILVDADGNKSEPIDSKATAKDRKRSMEQLGKEVELQETEGSMAIEDDSHSIDAEVIEMSGGDGGNDHGQNDDDSANDNELEIVGTGGAPYVFCDNCGRLSACVYRCPDPSCGADLTDKPYYRGGGL